MCGIFKQMQYRLEVNFGTLRTTIYKIANCNFFMRNKKSYAYKLCMVLKKDPLNLSFFNNWIRIQKYVVAGSELC